MKSWRERLVRGLRNWRSRKSDVAPDHTIDAERAGQPDEYSKEKTPINAPMIDFEEKVSRASQQIDAAISLSDIQRSNDDDEPTMPGKVSEGGGQTGREEYRQLSLTQYPASSTETRGRPKKGKDLGAHKGAPANEARGVQSLTSNIIKTPDQDLAKQASDKILKTNTDGSDDKAIIQTRCKIPSQGSATAKEAEVLQKSNIQDQLPQTEIITNNDTVSVVPASVSKPSSRRRKTEIAVEEVTSEELAELEAENARLRVLLQQKLNVRG